jgi:uncharacterized protein YbaR (Trm112 family)
MLSQDLVDVLRCPADVRKGSDAGVLDLKDNAWLVCRDCGRKYPIVDGIPVMLIDEKEQMEAVRSLDG